MTHEKVASLLARNIWGLLTKPSNALPGTRPTAKQHMLQRAKRLLFLTVACSQETTTETKDLIYFSLNKKKSINI